MRTLVVEDVRFIGIILERILEPFSQTEFAADGQQAIDTFTKAFYRKEPFDLICLDILLPRIDGHEVLESIRSFEKLEGVRPENRVKIIIISNVDDQTSFKSAFESGCDAFISKPFNRKKILKEIEKLGLIGLKNVAVNDEEIDPPDDPEIP